MESRSKQWGFHSCLGGFFISVVFYTEFPQEDGISEPRETKIAECPSLINVLREALRLRSIEKPKKPLESFFVLSHCLRYISEMLNMLKSVTILAAECMWIGCEGKW